MGDFMLYFNVLIAIYLLYYAIKGSGKIYENEFPEEAKKAHNTFLRKFCWIVGVAMLVLSALELIFKAEEWAVILAWTNIIFVLAAVVYYIIIFKKKFGKYQR